MDLVLEYFTLDPPKSKTNLVGHVSSNFQTRLTQTLCSNIEYKLDHTIYTTQLTTISLLNNQIS